MSDSKCLIKWRRENRKQIGEGFGLVDYFVQDRATRKAQVEVGVAEGGIEYQTGRVRLSGKL